jgi:hypothetical protein
MSRRGDVRTFLQRFAGYCLTGEVGEKKFLMLTGTGDNGKTMFVGLTPLGPRLEQQEFFETHYESEDLGLAHLASSVLVEHGAGAAVLGFVLCGSPPNEPIRARPNQVWALKILPRKRHRPAFRCNRRRTG